MGSAFSKRKHKGKWLDKETWTGECEAAKAAIADIKTADVGHQCVLQWIQKITTDENTNLDDRPKRPHSEIYVRSTCGSLDPMVGKIDLSCCDWLHRIGQSQVDQLESPRSLSRPDGNKQEISTRSTPEISSLSDEKQNEEIENEITEIASLKSFPKSSPAPEAIKKLTDDEKENREVDLMGIIGDPDSEREMSHQATSIKKLKSRINEQSEKMKMRKRRAV
ncbi:unnamed protein product [Rodentolepis nana]|uniref:Myb_DNA-bind_5 domain-containing protein n=1 Tax=Rodentolepis nana TaxID=102285 RepID=A0A0R3T9C2_RODNA|nr:unnamed protein product [Rodentolepis nana]